jgi:hypothetical protein
MDESLQVAIELTTEEVNWRPVPEANNINLIVRHLRIFVGLEQQSGRAYRDAGQGSAPNHFLGFHLAVHLARHWGQVGTLRNLYCRARGEPARFFPDNPSFLNSAAKSHRSCPDPASRGLR